MRVVPTLKKSGYQGCAVPSGLAPACWGFFAHQGAGALPATAPGPLWRLFVEAGLSPRFGTHSLHSEGVTAAVNNRADCSLVQQLGAGRVRRFREHNGEDSTAAGAWVMTLLTYTNQ
ncbi:hypothetical protein VOLCADRAFT_95051 [Volvox carteri f. nagariensis]|uniref:Uncharacterized protein n=1 Tax=Volvox carteri f. nagariensis TaxID=3068 RepID=D8U6G6_VOLCA|nr:uncharacterized protein VOLCADRAFT_95051 [Volvox carteri f. nagariensis]EFJ44644.1 hypothetical protein VOLCADRAFT_95051 [Volvox carteri f. nagariensis]|eukprot:XP_002954220.1 hypothetical protein VOLCADRAFT_95051 [Volvox carteri f. nagariensis]